MTLRFLAGGSWLDGGAALLRYRRLRGDQD